MRAPGRDERGSAPVELMLLVGVFLAAVLLLGTGFRLTQAATSVRHAAGEAARAATLHQHAGAARDAAAATVTRQLDGQGVTCADVAVTVDTGALVPGGAVTVTVACTARLDSLTGWRLPATTRLTATVTEPVDAYRGDP